MRFNVQRLFTGKGQGLPGCICGSLLLFGCGSAALGNSVVLSVALCPSFVSPTLSLVGTSVPQDCSPISLR